jgi:hypothetical protein
MTSRIFKLDLNRLPYFNENSVKKILYIFQFYTLCLSMQLLKKVFNLYIDLIEPHI